MENPIIIHILADFDEQAPETVIYKAAILSRFPSAVLLFDHQPFKKGDVISPACYLKLILPSFPAPAYHLLLLHTESRFPEKFIYAVHQNRHFLAPDNGILPLCLGENPEETHKPDFPANATDTLLQVYLPALQQVTENSFVTMNWQEVQPKQMIMQQPTQSGNTYRLSVMYNDSQGNAYLNMDQTEFNRITEGRQFSLRLGARETISQVSRQYRDVPEGSKLMLFGLGNLLQIAVNCGSAAQYLGLKTGQMVMLDLES